MATSLPPPALNRRPDSDEEDANTGRNAAVAGVEKNIESYRQNIKQRFLTIKVAEHFMKQRFANAAAHR